MMIVMIVATVMCIRLYAKDSVNTIRFVCCSGEQNESISLYSVDDEHYLFLPGYADPGNLKIEYDADYSLYIDGVKYPSGTVCSSLQAGRSYEMVMKDGFGLTSSDGILTVRQGGNIAALSIHLTNGTVDQLNSSKDISKTGYCSLIRGDGSLDYYGELKEIHGRGNTTWREAKKSYLIKFPVTTDVLGMGPGENWVLLSNSFDESGLKNKLVFDMADMIGAEYPVSSAFIDLYIDDVYYGEYLLAEKVEVDGMRVDITDLESATESLNPMSLSNYTRREWSQDDKIRRGYDISDYPDDITGGYLFQIEHHSDRIAEKESVFQTDLLSFSVVSPKYAGTEEIDYIAGYVQACEDSIRSGDLSMIDVDSFVNYYLIQELFANYDDCSVFLYKDSDLKDPKLHICAPWDFDLSIGNGWRVYDVNPAALYRDEGNWFDLLLENEIFREKLSDRYEELMADGLSGQLAEHLAEYLELTGNSFEMNRIRWSEEPSESNWAFESQRHYQSLEEQVRDMDSFLSRRVDYLKSVWVDGAEYCKVTFVSDFHYSLYEMVYSVEPGSTLQISVEDPEPLSSTGVRFLGWFDREGNEFEPGRPITEDVVYKADWEEDLAFESGIDKLMKFIVLHRMKLMTYGGVLCVGLLVAGFGFADLKRMIKGKRKDH